MVPIKSREKNKIVIGYLGMTIMIAGIIVMLPLVMLLPYPEEVETAKYFIIPGVFSLLLGYLMVFFVKDKAKGNLDKYQSAFIVTMAWLIAIFVTGMPFLLTGEYNFTQSMFEACSGWSTTGLSVVDVENTAHTLLFLRSVMQLFGGVGLVLVMLSFLTDAYGMRLYYAEGHPDKLLPNLIESSRLIMKLYLSYIFLGTLAYMFFGVNWFDALNHAIASVATGGFSTKSASIAYFDSVAVEAITIILMLLGATNFVAAIYMVKGKYKNFFRYCEVRVTIVIVVLFTLLLTVFLDKFHGMAPLESFRVAIFHVVSASSCTGFQTTMDLKNLTGDLVIPLVILMVVGGQSGSTAGGVKQYRAHIMLKSIYWNLRDTVSPPQIIRANFVRKPDSDEIITDKQYGSICAFLFAYGLVLLLGTLIICCFGYSLTDSLFEFSSAMGGVGLSSGITGFDQSPIILWTLFVGMFLGRLEIIVVFVAIIKIFKIKK